MADYLGSFLAIFASLANDSAYGRGTSDATMRKLLFVVSITVKPAALAIRRCTGRSGKVALPGSISDR